MPDPQAIAGDAQFVSKADIVIIGAGIAGICTALELAERGLQVVVCEKGIVAGEQSSKNWGWCRKMGRDPRELPLASLSLQLWREMRQRIGSETGFRECGIVFLCDTDAKMAKRVAWSEENAEFHGLSTHIIDQHRAAELAPGSTVAWKGGLYTPDEGRAEPQIAVPAIAEAARRLGVRIYQNCAVRGLMRNGGAVAGVVTERGEVACDRVVLAGGAWSRRFCHNEGIALPQLTVTNSVSRTAPIDLDIDTTIAAGRFAIRKRLDGGYTLADNQYNVADIIPDSFRLFRLFLPHLVSEWGDLKLRIGKRFVQEVRLKRRWQLDETTPFEQVRRLEPEPAERLLDEALSSLTQVFPQFAQARIVERWAGGIDVVPDAVPIMSAVDAVPGFYIMTGFSGHGFGLGPGAGRLMAQIVCNEPTAVDAAPFAFSRFQ
ncbi:MAG: FAD-binding oxidoreductase [Ahrensia sp.]|nr:FAD-binding oxidoreductase [Ahrensia sp.]